MICIYNFARGARGLRIVWQCEEMGLSYATERLDYPVSAAFRAKNPLGTVPYLEDDDGVGITESVAMMLYLAERYGPTPLLPASKDPKLARVLELVAFSEATLGAGLNTLMAAHFAAPEPDKQNWSATGADARVRAGLEFISQRLGDRPYFVGDDLTLADIAIATGLGMWSGALGREMPEPLARWRDRLLRRPAYGRAVAACS